jgi:hypothetical protein
MLTSIAARNVHVRSFDGAFLPTKEVAMNEAYSENDPDFHPTSACTLSAIFDSRSEAQSAVARLQDVGIEQDHIHFLPNICDDCDGSASGSAPMSFWNLLESWLFPDSERAAYSEHLRRGGFLVSITDVEQAQYKKARNILADEGSIDIDERADQWRREGWTASGKAGSLGEQD